MTTNQTSHEKLMNDVEDELVELKELVNQLVKLRRHIGDLKVELAIQDHSVCLEILKTMDQFTMNNST